MTRIRCAIYTRKSSDEGLDQAFNSLDAQREACAAYIQSQKHEAWRLVPTRYDDGGLSGGTLERPALQRLMADIDAGKVDMVVVYRVDRLTRSLADFAKLVDRLDAADASFVSVTQQFNTSTSMGRLTLNVLLSFAQFEREVTAERIRDKIAASKAKGLWMGGPVPLGYDKGDQGLVINVDEAATVHRLFEAYLDLGCVRKLKDYADAHGLVTKRHQFTSGRVSGGVSFSRGRLYHLLSNPIYIGKIRHKEKTHTGQHEAIIEIDLWDEVQAQLARNRHRRASRTNAANPSPLAGKVFDDAGKALMASHATKNGRRYRYYISKQHVLQSGSQSPGWRLPAPELEAAVHRAVSSNSDVQLALAGNNAHPETDSDWFALVKGVSLETERLRISMGIKGSKDDEPLEISTPFILRRRGTETRLCLKTGEQREPDKVLIRRIAKAMDWSDHIKAGTSITQIAEAECVSPEYVGKTLKFAFLAPTLLQAICYGKQRADITTDLLYRAQIPLDWTDQERCFM
ncbi:MAG: recombinase family protein [Pseudomonadota bacterium]